MKKRNYKITFGLKEGYSKNAKVHTMHFAEKVIHEWMKERLRKGYPIVSGLLQSGKLFYPAPGKEQNEKSIAVSHSCIFTGDLSAPEDIERENREVKITLEDLAFKIKSDLGQESVFIIYRNSNWCI